MTKKATLVVAFVFSGSLIVLKQSMGGTDMDSKDKRAREVQEKIRKVLLSDWDPLGVAKEREMRDEYDAYIGEVYRLLASGARPADIAQHLAAIERDQIGFETPPDRLLPVAEKLCALNVKLGGSEQSA